MERRTMMKRILAKLRNARLLLEFAGPKVFFRQMRMHLYNRDSFVGYVRDLASEDVPVQARIAYRLRPGTKEDIDEVLARVRHEGKNEVVDLLDGVKLYEAGFDCFYTARTAETNEICMVGWWVTSKYNGLIRHYPKLLGRPLRDDEVMAEYGYTFKDFRGLRIAPAVRYELCNLLRKKGFKRIIGYVSMDNVASLKSFSIGSDGPFEQVRRHRVLFIRREKRTAIGPAGRTE
jgi:hypothetical protein